jgi:hypothetical protein
MARPSKFKPEYNDLIVKFFSGKKYKRYVKSEKTTTKSNGTTETWREYGYMCNDLPTFSKFATKIEVDDDTLENWAKEENKKKYPGFFGAYNKCKQLQKEFLSDNALKGFHPPATFIFVAKNITDWKDRTENDVTSAGKPIPIQVVRFSPNSDGK